MRFIGRHICLLRTKVQKNESRTKRIHSFFMPSDSTFADSSAKVRKKIHFAYISYKINIVTFQSEYENPVILSHTVPVPV